MKDRVRGVFRDEGRYNKYDGTWKIFFRSFASDEIHTGVIIAPGIRATPAKHKGSSRFNSIANINIDEYPVMVDRADPRRS
jgi:hypothetical protein